MASKAKSGSKAKSASAGKKKKTLKRADIKVVSAIRLPGRKDKDHGDGTDPKTDPKVGKNPNKDFRNIGDRK